MNITLELELNFKCSQCRTRMVGHRTEDNSALVLLDACPTCKERELAEAHKVFFEAAMLAKPVEIENVVELSNPLD